METVYLIRTSSGDQGTFGSLFYGGKRLYTAELPWRDNRTNMSCIPAGEYTCVPFRSKRFGRVFHVQGVPGRTAVLIHSGNYAGDTEQGFKTHSHGCILLGLYPGRLGSQRAVLASRSAVSQFVRDMDDQPLKLIIEEV